MSVPSNYWSSESVAERFWSKVKVSDTGCWLWGGATNHKKKLIEARYGFSILEIQ